jgi:anti-sigma factor (TIGR02949 family)
MECKTIQALLESYLDNELARADARALEAHIDSCAECSALLTRLDALRRALRDGDLRYAAPTELRARIAASATSPESTDGGTSPVRILTANPSVRPRRTPAPWLRYAAACVLAFGAGSVSMALWNASPANTQSQLTRDLYASHWRALVANSPVDVVSSDRHTVKPWFAGKVAQAPVVRDFAEQGFALVGGRIDYVGAQRVPVLVYRHGQHLIDVFVLAGESATIGSASLSQGYRLEPIKLGDEFAAVVSDMDQTEFTRFAQLLAVK